MLLPMVFLLTAATAAVGPGATLAVALIAPFAMSAATRLGYTPFLVSVVVCHGSGAGFLSPFSTTGAVAGVLLNGTGLGGHQYWTWGVVAAAHTAMAAAAYVLFGRIEERAQAVARTSAGPLGPLTYAHRITAIVTIAWILAAAFLRWPLGWSALAAGILLWLARAASPRAAVARMPWKLLALVTAISVTVSLLNRSGGLEWFKTMLVWIATPGTIHAAIAFVGGVISAYSSTTAVVMPAFLPMVPSIAERFTGVDPVALATSLLLGATLVDVSPLSTSGALCVAAAPHAHAPTPYFRKLLLWGLAMAPIAAAICQLAYPAFAP
jgi:di/tricarboxylate transporter